MIELKGRVLQGIRDLLIKKAELLKQHQEAKERYIIISQEYPAQIQKLQTAADLLASKFKELYRQSQAAYSSGAGALAKQLSQEGHLIQSQCGEFNDQANAMRSELKALPQAIPTYAQQARQIQSQIFSYTRSLEQLRQTRLRGWENSGILDDLSLDLYLDTFPQQIFQFIKTVEYAGQVYWESSVRKFLLPAAGETIWDSQNNATIKIGQIGGDNSDQRIENLKQTIAHEIGHCVYEALLTDEDKADWFAYHSETSTVHAFMTTIALASDTEDFAECFRYFYWRPKELERKEIKKYSFLQKLHSSLPTLS